MLRRGLITDLGIALGTSSSSWPHIQESVWEDAVLAVEAEGRPYDKGRAEANLWLPTGLGFAMSNLYWYDAAQPRIGHAERGSGLDNGI